GVVGLVAATRSGGSTPRVEAVELPVHDGPRHDELTTIDASIYLPSGAGSSHRQPAVVLGHGFGGDKADVRGDAENLARQGYVVLTPSARGFGLSNGRIGLGLPDYDGTDLKAELDYLATRPEVALDKPGDPRVGLAGASYGGGLALNGAAEDQRVDATVGIITWNSLASALEPDAADPAGNAAGRTSGVFKQLYAGVFFGSGATGPGRRPNPCGRFTPEACTAYQQAADPAGPPAAIGPLLAQAGVGSRLASLRVPTLLIQGENDTLFPLSEAVRTYTSLRDAGVPTAMMWTSGGHDSPFEATETQRIRDRSLAWFDTYLRHSRTDSGPGFTWVDGRRSTTRSAAAFPVPGTEPTRFVLGGGHRLTQGGTPGAQQLVNPPGGHPTGISSLPGLAGLGAGGGGGAGASLLGQLAIDPPSQAASWTSDQLTAPMDLVGQSTVTVHVASTSDTAVLFAKLYDVDSSGSASLPNGQVAPLRVTGVAGGGRDLTVSLPTLAHSFATGHRVRLVLASTDAAYANAPAPAVISVSGVVGGGLTMPTAPTAASHASGLVVGLLVALAVVVLLAVLGTLLTRRNRKRALHRRGSLDATPVQVRHLTKVYADGHRAVDDVSFSVSPGQIVGLLGPNGAGKTTTLRMMLGLISPSAGEAVLFGEKAGPGAPVLSRLGTFVEGPGLLPHLSGRENLHLWWRSTGADLADARMDEALEVAGLGSAIDKPVRSYSHGMKQRVALAQSLLGMPDCLVLDEPTNGLDPPQIREMRELIRRYAATGRTVLLSSHLLSEVELICTHVVVMQSGRLIYDGTVDDLLSRSSMITVQLAETSSHELDRAREVLTGVDGVSAVTAPKAANGQSDGQPDRRRLAVVGDPSIRPALLRALLADGIDVEEISVQRNLEDVFLALVGADATGHAVGSGGRPSRSADDLQPTSPGGT
ncbi:MAG: type transport system ATP-binding protein, partial [Frankiaceae bacterium]|nr:type transport system ATP-binding protein [Frankiaceae bacterium]